MQKVAINGIELYTVIVISYLNGMYINIDLKGLEKALNK